MRRGLLTFAGLVAAMAASLGVALGAGGSLDHSFSHDGKALVPLGDFVNVVYDVDIDHKGRILLTGTVGRAGSKFAFGVVRLKPSGALDKSFSGDGKQTIVVGDSSEALSAAIDKKNRIVIAGYTDDSPGAFALARLTSKGRLDKSFSGDGKRTSAPAINDNFATDVAIDPQGRIVVVGGADNGIAGTDFAVERFKPNGNLDHSFSGDGQILPVVSAQNDSANAVAIQRDGRIVVGGSVDINGGKHEFTVLRLKANGNYDKSFGNEAYRFVKVADDNSLSGLQINRSGKIYLEGSEYVAGAKGLVARLTKNGSLDHSFSGDGKLKVTLGTQFTPGRGALDRKGRLLLTGSTFTGTTYQVGIARIKPSGALDRSFSADGRATISLGSFADSLAATADSRNRPVVSAYSVDDDINYTFAAARLKP